MIIRNASFVILKKEDKFLFYLRDNKPSITWPNYWSLIGGAIDNGETPIEALNREIEEEIAQKVRDIEFIGKLEFKKDENNDVIYFFIDEFGKKIEKKMPNIYGGDKIDHIIYFFTGEINKEVKEINLTEGQLLSYFTFEELEKLNIVPPVKDFIICQKNKLLALASR